MYRTLLIGIAAASPLLVLGVTRQSHLERRLVSLEEFTREVPTRQDRDLRELSSRLDGLPGETQVTALQTRLHSLESRLAEARRAQQVWKVGEQTECQGCGKTLTASFQGPVLPCEDCGAENVVCRETEVVPPPRPSQHMRH